MSARRGCTCCARRGEPNRQTGKALPCTQVLAPTPPSLSLSKAASWLRVQINPNATATGAIRQAQCKRCLRTTGPSVSPSLPAAVAASVGHRLAANRIALAHGIGRRRRQGTLVGSTLVALIGGHGRLRRLIRRLRVRHAGSRDALSRRVRLTGRRARRLPGHLLLDRLPRSCALFGRHLVDLATLVVGQRPIAFLLLRRQGPIVGLVIDRPRLVVGLPLRRPGRIGGLLLHRHGVGLVLLRHVGGGGARLRRGLRSGRLGGGDGRRTIGYRGRRGRVGCRCLGLGRSAVGRRLHGRGAGILREQNGRRGGQREDGGAGHEELAHVTLLTSVMFERRTGMPNVPRRNPSGLALMQSVP
ncbi:hypothetical protein NOVOSPHI9U_40424 [Novosphingobium sp. 9U]|nr:hypothetical protein NOVOSPHI9U_40424 [Novosphingobium sp. 9U]